jgi:intein-encoded DNA endonuclease-like protein
MAYVIGFFAADGYMTLNRRGGQFWSIQIIDKSLLQNIRSAIGAEHAIGVRVGKGNNKTSYRLQIGSIEMCDDLRMLGFNRRKAKNLALPNIPKKYFPDFIRGYFDGDGNVWMGYIHKGRKVPMLALRVVFTSCSENFLSSLRMKLHDVLGMTGAIISERSYSRLQYSIKDSLRLHHFMYGEIGKSKLFLRRKSVIFERYLKRIKMRA